MLRIWTFDRKRPTIFFTASLKFSKYVPRPNQIGRRYDHAASPYVPPSAFYDRILEVVHHNAKNGNLDNINATTTTF